MSANNKRTVLVDSISYLSADGTDQVARRGDEVTVHADGVAHFDWVHDATPEAQGAARLAAAEGRKPAPAAKKASESA